MNPSVETLQEAFQRLAAPAASAPPLDGTAGRGPEAAAPEATPAAAGYAALVKAGPASLDAALPPDQVVAAARLLAAEGFAIDTITGVDWLAAGEMEVVYDFFHFIVPVHVVLRTRVPRDRPEVPTISGIYPGANWPERETHEFFGIRFLGHPDLSPLLLPEDATYHPLRKDFAGVA